MAGQGLQLLDVCPCLRRQCHIGITQGGKVHLAVLGHFPDTGRLKIFVQFSGRMARHIQQRPLSMAA
jgi:hypothetical protein